MLISANRVRYFRTRQVLQQLADTPFSAPLREAHAEFSEADHVARAQPS
jgi:hypothetical protein